MSDESDSEKDDVNKSSNNDKDDIGSECSTDPENETDEDLVSEESSSDKEGDGDSSKKNKMSYTTDGILPEKYNKHNCEHKNLHQADCCQRYFNKDAYSHQTLYKLSIPGINTCIHCFIGFDVQKYAECDNLTQSEVECLKYYIENFTASHNSEFCSRIKQYGKCLLCESVIGIKPKILRTIDDTSEYVETSLGTSDDPRSIIISDIILIDKPNEDDVSDYVLVL